MHRAQMEALFRPAGIVAACAQVGQGSLSLLVLMGLPLSFHWLLVVALLAAAAGSLCGLPYFTMPYVRGESLRQHLATVGELPLSEAVRTLREIASALAYAHKNHVVHRDIKPENVLISGGSAVVTDFGVAKALTASADETSSSLTSMGVALGTPAYMAPEQATADPHVDYRADIYALGIMAYEMVTGATPFPGRSPQATLAAHVTETPENVSRRRSNIPPGLASIIMRCLEKRPADRPQSAQISGLRVAARTSSFQFKGRNADIREVASKLGVSTVLEGSVRKSGDRMRITAQLIDAKTGYHMWSQTFDRKVTDVFAVQDEITKAIGAALQVHLGSAAQEKLEDVRPKNAKAHDFYLKGLYALNLGTKREHRAGTGAMESPTDSNQRSMSRNRARCRFASCTFGWSSGSASFHNSTNFA